MPNHDPQEKVSLRDYIESRFASLEQNISSSFSAIKEATSLALNAMNEATNLARLEMDRRLAGMNEFREQLNKQAGTFLSKDEYSQAHSQLKEQVSKLVPKVECETNHAKVEADVRVLREFKATLEGKASQESVQRVNLYALLGAIIGTVALILNIAERIIGK